MKEVITLSYKGGPADRGEMDAYTMSDSMRAFSDLVGICAHTLELEREHVHTYVAPPQSGSTVLQFAVEIGGAAATLLSGVTSPTQIFSLMGNVINGFKLLEGTAPTSTKIEGSKVEIKTKSGQVIYMDRPVFNIVSDQNAGRAAGKIFNTPVSDGVDTVEIRTGGNQSIAEVDKSTSRYFTSLQTELPILDYQQPINLEIIAPVFKDDKKWQFSDGQIQFWATVPDLTG